MSMNDTSNTSDQLVQARNSLPEKNKYGALRTRAKVYLYSAISLIVLLVGYFVFLGSSDVVVSIEFSLFFCLGIGFLIILMFTLTGIADMRKKSVFKLQFTDAIADEIFCKDDRASELLYRRNYSISLVLRALSLHPKWKVLDIATCFVGRVRDYPVAYLNFDLYHDQSRGKSSERIWDFAGELYILPVINTTTDRPFRVYRTFYESSSNTPVYMADTRFDIKSRQDLFTVITGYETSHINSFLPEVELLYFNDQISDTFLYALHDVYERYRQPIIASTDKLIFVVIPFERLAVKPFSILRGDEKQTAENVKRRLRLEAENTREMFEIFMNHEIY